MWLRLYTDVLDDPKVQWLSGDDFKGWINILCLAKENDGLLPSSKVIAFKLRITQAEANHLVEALTSAGLLDPTEDGLTPHSWDSRQFISDDDPTAALRARRYRASRNGVTDTVTRDVTDASRPSEAEQSRDRAETETEQSSPVSLAKPRSTRRPVCDEEYFNELQANPAYAMFDVRLIYHKMVAWCHNKGKQPTRSRLLNWLSREEKPMTTNSKPPTKANLGAPLPSAPVPAVEVDEFMAEHIDGLIEREDLIQLGNEYEAIVGRGGAKYEWEIRCVAYYELHKDEPASPEQMAQLNASINALANRRTEAK